MCPDPKYKQEPDFYIGSHPVRILSQNDALVGCAQVYRWEIGRILMLMDAKKNVCPACGRSK